MKVLVEVTRVLGSTPREVGAWMAVCPDTITGTIGGGQLEYMAIDAARAGRLGNMEIPLGPEIGQCCGGHVLLHLSEVSDQDVARRLQAEDEKRPTVLIFGAGHTGRALAALLESMPVRLGVVDSRAAELAALPAHLRHLTAIPEAEVERAEPGSAFVIMTHDHALDFLIAEAALRRGDSVYVGLIGSKTKRRRFESWIARQETPVPTVALTCPIGARGSADKRPEVVAAFTLAEVMEALTCHASVPA